MSGRSSLRGRVRPEDFFIKFFKTVYDYMRYKRTDAVPTGIGYRLYKGNTARNPINHLGRVKKQGNRLYVMSDEHGRHDSWH